MKKSVVVWNGKVRHYNLKRKPCRHCDKEFMAWGAQHYCDACREYAGYTPKPRKQSNCVLCSTDITDRGKNAIYCRKCFGTANRRLHKLALNDNEKARAITKYAVRIGFLPDPTGFKCVHCKRRQAECYDHRDYSKPLNVDPVCLPCNSSRGKGVAVHFPVLKSVAA